MSKITVMEQSNPNLDILKIIDEAMEKKDRTVSLYIGSHGMSVNVTPLADSGSWWIRKLDKHGEEEYMCMDCGHTTRICHYIYCPWCGEQKKGVKNNND